MLPTLLTVEDYGCAEQMANGVVSISHNNAGILRDKRPLPKMTLDDLKTRPRRPSNWRIQ